MSRHYILVDFENIQVMSLPLLDDESIHLQIFLGPTNTTIDTLVAMAIKDMGERAEYIRLIRSGYNSLDFYIAYHLGQLIEKYPGSIFHIISNDKGFDPLIEFLWEKGIAVSRAESIWDLPYLPSKKGTATRYPWEINSSTLTVEECVAKILPDILRKLQGYRTLPKRMKSLYHTIQTLHGTHLPLKIVRAVVNELIMMHYVELIDNKPYYNFPKRDENDDGATEVPLPVYDFSEPSSDKVEP